MGAGISASKNEAELFLQLKEAILSYNADESKSVASKILSHKIDPIQAMHHAVAETARLLGQKFENGQIFIPHLVMGGDILADVSSILVSAMDKDQSKSMSGRVVVIGTVESDVHSIGKNIVAMLLKANGYQVFDLGVDVKSETFIEQARVHAADVIALSSLLTTTMPYQEEVIEDLARLNIRTEHKVIVGGGPVTQAWADEIGADGYAKDAVEAIRAVNQLISS